MTEPWSPVQPIIPEVSDICMQVQPDIERMAGTNFAVYNPVSFASEIVLDGTNYVVKVDVGRDCVHAMISAVRSVNDFTLTVLNIKFPKTLSDPLVPF